MLERRVKPVRHEVEGYFPLSRSDRGVLFPPHMLLAPIHEALEALLGGHGHDFSSVAVSDEARAVDLRDRVFQRPAITATAGPCRKNDNAIHAVPGCIVSCRLYARCAGLVSNRPGPVVDFSFQIDKVARTPGIDAVTHD